MIEIAVTGYANGGAGVARHDGRVVFVTGALPGERVRARITDARNRRFARAETVEVLERSPHRIAPACPAAADGAGCCDLSHVAPDHARTLGRTALADVLARIGGFDLAERPGPEVRALGEEPTGWRIRTRLAVGRDGRAGLRAVRSSRIVETACTAPVPGLVDGVDSLGAQRGSEIVLMADAAGRRHAVQISGAGGAGRSADPSRRGAQRRRRASAAARPTRILQGAATAEQRVGHRSWQIPTTGFWQAHRAAPSTYSSTVLTMLGEAGLSGRVTAWDLYGGAGVFSAALLDGGVDHGFAVRSVDLVDTDRGALAAADAAFAADPVRTHHGGVETLVATLDRPDLVVADPPRAGAGHAVVDAVAAAGPRAVIQVGCDPAAFARDVGRYASHGYRVRAWCGYEAFPMTHHLEALALLTR
ncbi:class I SAM-dependent RNA methyltransferase [Gordonia shandongensis]|uniref:class I SAM-dependent RNA methyltransferase n=1 Tax=Gordonia shandongensis TaxID=376351 RepID=UPI001FE00E72|nr:TRAM domain-containing protein [Gordonia shandongensis]